jgi:hypothetical protein
MQEQLQAWQVMLSEKGGRNKKTSLGRRKELTTLKISEKLVLA